MTPSTAWRRLHLRVVSAITLAFAGVLVVIAAAVWQLEKDADAALIRTYPDALWWAMETISTVGYGDLHPVTLGGRLVAVLLMMMGIALVGVITATVVAWFFGELELLREVERVEESEMATLDELLAEVRELRRGMERTAP